MAKISMEAEVKLSVVLTGLLKITTAKLAVSNVSVDFMEAEKTGSVLDVELQITRLDEAFLEMEKAAEQLRLFRNILRDDRKPFVKRMARDHWREPKLSERDPKEFIDAIVKQEAA